MARRLKVLVVAASVHPLKGSEPGMGWNWLLALSKYHELWAIIGEREDNREAIEDYLGQYPESRQRLKIHYIPRPNPPHMSLARILPPYYYYYYRAWHRKAFRLAKELSSQIEFDIAHQLNMIGYREPGYLWRLPLPFVWGPIGGYNQMPWRFMSLLCAREACYHTCRNIVNAWQMRMNVRVKRAMRCAAGVIAANRENLTAIKHLYRRETFLLGETGANSEGNKPRRPRALGGDGPIRICWCGKFVGRKALPIALSVLASLRKEMQLELHVVGDGPRRKRWKQMAVELGVSDMCHWYGSVPRSKAIEIMSGCHVLLFTSLGEGTPHVVLEALSLGVPVICHNAFGSGAVVDDSCGITVPMKDPRLSCNEFAEAIRRLGRTPGLLENLSAGACACARRLTWDEKARQMCQIYSRVMGSQRTMA